MRTIAGFFAVFAVLGITACDRTDKKSGEANKPSVDNKAKSNEKRDHPPDDGHGHGSGATGDAATKSDHGGEVIDLGTSKAGSLTVRASRDKGDIKPGGDSPIDVWLTTEDGKPAQVAAVRFWVGTEDGKGSVKAKAEIEDPKQTNHWHTHAEVPEPMPAGGKLWVEIEETAEKKTLASFDLKG